MDDGEIMPDANEIIEQEEEESKGAAAKTFSQNDDLRLELHSSSGVPQRAMPAAASTGNKLRNSDLQRQQECAASEGNAHEEEKEEAA